MNVAAQSAILIRAFGVNDDLQAVLDLARRTFGALDITPPSSVLRETLDDFRARLQSQNLLIATSEDKVIGAVFCVPKSASLHLSRLVVAPERQRRGVGHKMLDAATGQAKVQGLAVLSLSTRIALDGNRRFFESYGFHIVKASTHAGYDAPTSYEMEKRLT